jgi:hypothetical protein
VTVKRKQGVQGYEAGDHIPLPLFGGELEVSEIFA